MTKKKVLALSSVGTIIAFTRGTLLYCSTNDWICRDKYDGITLYFIIFVPVFFFSLILYRMKHEIFSLWRKFALCSFFASIIITAIIPDSAGIMQVIDKEFTTIAISFLFALASLAIIARKSYQLRKK